MTTEHEINETTLNNIIANQLPYARERTTTNDGRLLFCCFQQPRWQETQAAYDALEADPKRTFIQMYTSEAKIPGTATQTAVFHYIYYLVRRDNKYYIVKYAGPDTIYEISMLDQQGFC